MTLNDTHCTFCGAPLRGGATVHKDDCPIAAIIRSAGDDYSAPAIARKIERGDPFLISVPGLQKRRFKPKNR